ncbi:SusC/RagA family TonB-linked outer membrane protein [Olivibacter domesticus]|uniref:TonB-linked outer membrane protein, SusC/RagA family n=1 Tax=Olivibacter domesticus TaxID=407022 RepID=A0A1H7YUI9_OLID1|nr:SusC/RagA family TonB-linked outer membrane protein [Olivibacter domesticus]SEM49892.1 TonB-linked outer membrane protein, SusC/RagA family [Olivibacter domesticus]
MYIFKNQNCNKGHQWWCHFKHGLTKIVGAFMLLSWLISCFPRFAVAAVQQTVRGKVVSAEDNTPLPGVTVRIKGEQIGTNTNAEGLFELQASTNSVLEFSYLGYVSKEEPVSNRMQINVSLSPNIQSLEEVTVSVGYGTLKQKEVTSAVAHIDTAQFRQSGARNPLDLIQGKVAGLQVTRTSGSNPNTAVAVQLRGVVSVAGSASPLYVIDGIPGGNMDLLQQDDIESIDVLKDGSGAAIYGSSANAGVILVTTKKGKAGTSSFTYNNYARKEYVARRPNTLSAEAFREKVNSGEINQQDFGQNTDFYDMLINHSNLSNNHNLAMSGGTSNTNYRASVNYRNLEGISLANARQEYGARLNVNQKGLDDRLNVMLNLATNFNKQNRLGGGGWESEVFKNPTLSNFNEDGSYRFDLISTNEYARLMQETSWRKQQTTSGDFKADLDLLPGLRGSVFGSYQRESRNDSQYAPQNSEGSLENTDYPGGAWAAKGDFLSESYAFEPTLQYQKLIAEKHNLTAIAGYSYRYYKEEGFNAENRGFINDLFHEDNLGSGTALIDGKAGMSSFKNDNTLIAFFGRINYTFNSKYMAQFILRREGSSRFGDNNKWGNFPAVSAGWTVSEENFMKNVTFVDFLKLRAGYGVTGNSGFANNASRVTLGGGGRYLYPDGFYRETYGPNRNPNPNLKWETKRELNIGIDYALFNSKLSGSIDVYNRKTNDLLDTYTSPQPPFIRDQIYTNVGSISSKGIEVAFSYKAVDHRDFKWSVDLAASTTKNVLDTYSNDIYTVEYKTFGSIGGAGDLGEAFTTYEGEKVGEFWGKRFAGFTEDGKWLFYNRNGEAVRNDQINNSKDRSVTDLAPIGNAVPKYYLSLTNSFKYKQFDFRIFMRGKFDYDILNTMALSYGNKTWSGNLLKETFTEYSEINDTYMYSDYYLESGSYWKIDEITLGYTFKLPSKLIKNLRVYATGQNLATITGYSGNDPDLVSDTGLGNPDGNDRRLGIDNRSSYPSTRSFLFGLNLAF